jgi:ABC-type amino acid transport substrate-binding protein
LSHPIPEAALANHIAILGKTGSGKSWTARSAVEGILDRGGRACIIDPTSAWWGLKSSATGKSGGYPVVIFGGEHADLPLAGNHGEALAEIIGTSSTPAILDVSLMRVGERTRFFADFADALVRKNKGPLNLVIDEAHLFAPQGKVNDPQSGAMLHAANNLVSLGRSKGLRIMLITQRPAKLHKDSLTQVETLVAMRLIAPQDRKAVEEWIKDNADQEKGREIISSLATLKTGHGWIWAPELQLLERVQFPRIRTFDSSRAPDSIADAKVVLAPIDRETIASRLQAVAADAVANDPATLKRRIAELERQTRQKPTASPEALQEAETRGYQNGLNAGRRESEQERRALQSAVRAAVDQAFQQAPVALSAPAAPAPRPAPRPVSAAVVRVQNGDASLGKCETKILTVLAQHQDGCEIGKLTLLTGYRKSGGFLNSLSTLRTMGLIEGANTGTMRITGEGLRHGPFPDLPQGDDLLRYWVEHPSFGVCERKILAALADARGGLTAEEICAETGYAKSGGFLNSLSALRTAGVLVGRNTETMRLNETITG